MQNTSIKTEILAGLTSFVTMAYVVFINPAILKETGMDQGSIFVATCLVSAFGCFLAGFFANSPIGIAPGMALNLYFCYSVVLKFGIPWEEALGIIFCSGLIFLVVSILGFGRAFLRALPHNLQVSILIGISLFIALVALKTNNIIGVDGNHLLHLSNIKTKEAILFFLGFAFILLLDHYRCPVAIILGIFLVTILSLCLGVTKWSGFFMLPPSIKPTFLHLKFTHIFDGKYLNIIFIFVLITMLDAAGTLIGLLNPAVFSDKKTHDALIRKSLIANAASSFLASMLGSSATTPFIESAAGIQTGGRRGVTAITIGCGFLLLLFCFPLAQAIPNCALGPALLYVAYCMLKNIVYLDFSDITQAAPSMLIMILIPYTSSIADGVGIGLILYTILRILTRQTVDFLLGSLSVLFLIFFICS